MEKLLLFALPDTFAVESIAAQLHIRSAVISPEQFDIPVGALAGFVTTQPSDVPAAENMPSEGMLLICGLNNSRLDRLLAELRRREIVIPYKAVLTPINADWTALQLVYELKREHEQFRKN